MAICLLCLACTKVTVKAAVQHHIHVASISSWNDSWDHIKPDFNFAIYNLFQSQGAGNSGAVLDTLLYRKLSVKVHTKDFAFVLLLDSGFPKHKRLFLARSTCNCKCCLLDWRCWLPAAVPNHRCCWQCHCIHIVSLAAHFHLSMMQIEHQCTQDRS